METNKDTVTEMSEFRKQIYADFSNWLKESTAEFRI